MARDVEWTLRLEHLPGQELTAALYGFDSDGQGHMVDVEVFGPFDSASDVSRWFLRTWSAAAGLPLR